MKRCAAGPAPAAIAAATPYIALVSARFRMLLQYRAAALAGMGTQLFWGLILVMVYEAFYRLAPADQPMELQQVINYVWLGQAMFAMLPWSIDGELRAMMRTGAVAYELVRPVDLYSLWYCRALASRAAPTALRAVPLFLAALLLLGLEPPASLANGMAWAAATAGALALGCALSNLMHVSLLWTLAGEGVVQLMSACVWLLSGMIIPLPLFPDWLQPLLHLLPFSGLADVAFRLYSGHLPPTALWGALAHQLLWTAALVVAGRLLLARGVRRLVVQGG